MSSGLFNLKKAMNVFGATPESLEAKGLRDAELPAFSRGSDNRLLKSWTTTDLPSVGEKIGFLPKLKAPIAASVFVTKGGVLKSSLTLNLARIAALHGVRTCVVGLDMQGDVTSALSADDTNDEESLEQALSRLNVVRGLADVFTGQAYLDDVLKTSDIPTLSFIPETPELVALDQSLVNRNRREYWLRDTVITPLKREFDLVLMDCSPNWNRLITNALVASDVLISPVECKINNFRNLKTFRALIEEFRRDMGVDFDHVFVPSRLSSGRKLSQEIFTWYLENLAPNCTQQAIRESIQGEEASAMKLSLPEYAPTSAAADEMRALTLELWRVFENAGRTVRPAHMPRAMSELTN
ncbi:MAG: ParA family protein [Bdellovibrionota bacterium]